MDTSLFIMPIINYKDDSLNVISNSHKRHEKTIFQPVFNKDNFPQIEGQVAIRKSGYGMWLNSLWPSLNGRHDEDRAVENNNPDETWGWLIKKGANVIQSDRAMELLEYLHKQGLHN